MKGLKLNLGSGDTWKPNAINIDRRMLKPPEQWLDYLRADAFDLEHYFLPESVEEMWANNILIGCDQEKIKRTLASWARLLKPGGALYVDHLSGDRESTSHLYFTRLLEEVGLEVDEGRYTKDKVTLTARKK